MNSKLASRIACVGLLVLMVASGFASASPAGSIGQATASAVARETSSLPTEPVTSDPVAPAALTAETGTLAVDSAIPIIPFDSTGSFSPSARSGRDKASMLAAGSAEKGALLSTPGGPTPNDGFDTAEIGLTGAGGAWGVTMGAGANIGVIDSGIDFGHEDLAGTWATQGTGPYAGWPIAFDAASSGMYSRYGIPHGASVRDLDWYSTYSTAYYSQMLRNGSVARDANGNGLNSRFTSYFNLTGTDGTLPMVVANHPANLASVGKNNTVVIVFSEPMDTASVAASLQHNGTGTLNWSWSKWDSVLTVWNMSGSWSSGVHQLNVTTGAMDRSGNALGAMFQLTFTVVDPDVVPPTVLMVSPPTPSIDQVDTVSWTLTFSEQMNAASVQGAISTAPPKTLLYEWNDLMTVLTVVPSTNLSPSTSYTLTVATTAKDKQMRPMAAPFSAMLTTEANDVIKPTVTAVWPTAWTTEFPAWVKIWFSESMDPTNFSATTARRAFQIFPNVNVDLTKDFTLVWNMNKTALTLVSKDVGLSGMNPASTFRMASIRVDDGTGKYLDYYVGGNPNGDATLCRHPADIDSLGKCTVPLSRVYSVGTGMAAFSPPFKLGVHKDLNLANTFGNRPGLLVANTSGAGYDAVTVDLNNNQMFDDETPVSKSTPTALTDWDGDGLADASTGLLYWISDGVNPPPYAAKMAARHGYPAPAVLAAGEMVLMHGAFTDSGFNPAVGHGTMVAGIIAGQGIGPYYPGAIYGVAPMAKLIGIGDFEWAQVMDGALNLNTTDALFYFAVEGYDGVVDSGDEADSVALTASPPAGMAGTSYWDRLVDYVQTVPGKGRTLFVAPAGDSGPGYSSISVFGAAPNVLTVGGTFSQYYRTDFGFDTGPHPNAWGLDELASSRGPTIHGQPKPDVVASSQFHWVAQPVSLGPGGSSGYQGLDLYGGTFLAAAEAAGAAGLAYSAWNKTRFGQTSTAWHIKAAVMAGATDLGADSLAQGTGRIHAGRAVYITNGTMPGSVHAYVAQPLGQPPMSSWTPGDFMGNASNNFMKFVVPGSTHTQPITIHNMGNETTTVWVMPGAVQTNSSASYSFTATAANRERFIINRSGIYAYATGVQLWVSSGAFRNSWDADQTLRITFIADIANAAGGNRIETFLWTDVDGNNAASYPAEINRMGVTFTSAAAPNVATLTVDHPSSTIASYGDARVKGIIADERFIRGSGTLVLEFNHAGAWSWLTTDKTNVTIPSGGQGTFNATLKVPADSGIGTYAGAIWYWDSASMHKTLLPVTFTTMSYGTSGQFGGYGLDPLAAAEAAAYSPGRILVRGTVDTRFVYFQSPSEVQIRPNERGIIDVDGENAGTAGDMRHYVTLPVDPAKAGDPANVDPGRFGSFSFKEIDVGAPGVFTKDGGGIAKAFTITPGINLLSVDYTRLSGKTVAEKAQGEVGVFEVNPVGAMDPAKPPLWYTSSNQRVGGSGIHTRSTVDWNGVGSVVTSTVTDYPVVNKDVPKYSCNNGACQVDYDSYVLNSPVSVFINLTPAITIVKWTLSPLAISNTPDLELGVYLDDDKDGVVQVADKLCWGVATGVNEKCEMLFPVPGNYIIKIVNFCDTPADCTPPIGKYSLKNDTLQVANAASIFTCNEPSGNIPANQLANLDVCWKFPAPSAPGLKKGGFFLSPGDAPFALMMFVEAQVLIDLGAPAFGAPTPADGAVVASNRPTFSIQVYSPNASTGFCVPPPPPWPADIDVSRTRVFVDGIDITADGKVTADGFSSAPCTSGTLMYTPGNILVHLSSIQLAEGPHVASVMATDGAGNMGSLQWSFVVDTTAPPLTLFLAGDPVIFTQATSWDLQGRAPGAAKVLVSVNGVQGADIFPSAGGDFATTFALNNNSANSISVEATDAAGNVARASKSIFSDQTAPELSEGPFTSALLTNRDTVTVRGRVAIDSEEGAVELKVNGAPTLMMADGSFATPVTLAEGPNVIHVEMTDLAGNVGDEQETVTRDSEAPILTVDPTPDRATGGAVTVTGKATDDSGSVTVLINGELVVLAAGGAFEKSVSVGGWAATIVISAQDDAGNAVSTVRSVANVPTSPGMSYVIGGVAFAVAVMAAILGLLIGMKMARSKQELPPPPPPPPPAAGEEKKDDLPPAEGEKLASSDEQTHNIDEEDELPPPPPPPPPPAPAPRA